MFLMSTLYQVQHNLLRQLDVRLDQARANVVFFDVQGDQQPASGFDRSGSRAPRDRERADRADAHCVDQREDRGHDARRRRQHHAGDSRSARQARSARHRNIPGHRRDRGDGTTASPWALRREFRSTYRADVTASEKLLQGKWFAPDDTTPRISVERELFEDLRLALGDTVTWNVQGVQVPTIVTQRARGDMGALRAELLRGVQSRARCGTHRSSSRCSPTCRTALQVATLQRDVVQRYPNVSSLDLSLIQKTVNDVLGKVTSAIRFMAVVCLGFGIPVLFSAVAATRRERLREGVLLKTLGATRRQVGRIMLVEYTLLGALGSLAGMLLSVRRGVAADEVRVRDQLLTRDRAGPGSRRRDDFARDHHRTGDGAGGVQADADGRAERSLTPPTTANYVVSGLED